MKLLQLNVWGGKLQYQIPDFLIAEKPDIICMQEVNDLTGSSGALFVTLDEMQQQAELPYKAMAPMYSHHYMNRDLAYGNAVLSRPNVLSNDIFFTYGSFTRDYDVVTSDDIRNFQHVVLDIDGKPCNIINHHGFFVRRRKEGNPETDRQIAIIGDYIEQLDGPIILTGDLNLVPTSQSLEPLNRSLRNLPVEYGLTSTYSRLSIHKVVCDYIFVSKGVTVNDFHVADDLVSDHKALVLDFDI